VLVSAGLLSKWGFNDGDEPDDVLDYLDEQLGEDAQRVNWHPILRRLVRERLITALDQVVVAVDVETIHNPIRASTVDGVDVGDNWYETWNAATLTPEFVEVPFDDVLALAVEQLAGGSELTRG
jgi:hypothetical protein